MSDTPNIGCIEFGPTGTITFEPSAFGFGNNVVAARQPNQSDHLQLHEWQIACLRGDHEPSQNGWTFDLTGLFMKPEHSVMVPPGGKILARYCRHCRSLYVGTKVDK